MMDDNNSGLKTFLKWAGIIALVAIPVVVLLKRREDRQPETSVGDDEGNIFSSEYDQ